MRAYRLANKSSLAMNGGKPVRDGPLPVMHPGAGYVGKEEIEAVTNVLKAKSMYRFYGPKFLNITGKFEDDIKAYFGRKYALAVTSGTAALHTALVGMSIGAGDEVILPTYAWVACPDAVVAAGATPVLADVDDSLTLDPADVERRITNRTKAIMAVHIRGTPANLGRALEGRRRLRHRPRRGRSPGGGRDVPREEARDVRQGGLVQLPAQQDDLGRRGRRDPDRRQADLSALASCSTT